MIKMGKVIPIGILFAIAIVIRIFLLPYSNSDLYEYVIPWLDTLNSSGGLSALKEPFYNYSPPYLYLLYIGSFLTPFIGKLAVIKIISSVFDFLLALSVSLIVKKNGTERSAWAAFFLVLINPVVLIDSAYWGQCDSIYSFFILLSLYFLLINRPYWAVIAFASGFAFKAQAIFLGPVILILLLYKKIPWRALFLFPLIYLAWMIPALVVGLPIERLALTYLTQAETYNQLSMNAPNIYKFIPNTYYSILVPAGIIVSGVITITLVVLIWKNNKPHDDYWLVLISVIFLLLLPLVLPKMHDRYFYPTTVLSICLPFFKKRFLVIPFILQTTSLLSFAIFLRGVEIIPIQISAVLNLISLGWLMYSYFYDRTTLELSSFTNQKFG